MRHNHPENSDAASRYLLAMLITLLYVIAAYLPGGRIWGFNLWTVFDTWLPPVLFAAGAVSLSLVYFFWRPAASPPADEASSNRFLWSGLVFTVAAGALFWLLRHRIHFLGDGYQILSHLAGGNPAYIKKTELGEAYLHYGLASLLGQGREAARLSYQLVSVFAGIGTVAAVLLAASRLFRSGRDRLLFASGLLTGGYMLLFFGYVENYSLLMLAIISFALIGVLAARGLTSRWLIVPPLVAALVLHVIGIVLLPAALYLLLADTRLASAPRKLRAAAAAILVAGGGVLFYHLYTTNYFFRYAFVPLVPIEITTEGYTLFSLNHVLDYLNLMILLLPALPLLIVTCFITPRRIFANRDYRFLSVLLFTAMSVAFVLDPKLGMPRDWDLFSFLGVPLALLFYLRTVESKAGLAHGARLAAYGIILGFLVLGPRVAIGMDAHLSLARVDQFVRLDRARSRAFMQVLREFHEGRGDFTAAEASAEYWRENYPEVELAVRASELMKMEQYRQAIPLCEQAIRINPVFWVAWTNLGISRLYLREYDLALAALRTANGINPDNPNILHNLGYGYLWAGDFDRAEQLWLRTLALDSSQVTTYWYLARLYEQTDRPQQQLRMLERAARLPDATPRILAALADHHLAAGRVEEAARLYRRALAVGLDSAHVRQQMEQYPALGPLLPMIE